MEEPANRPLTIYEKLQRLADEGLIEWNGQKFELPDFEPVPLLDSTISVSDIIVAMRDEWLDDLLRSFTSHAAPLDEQQPDADK